MATADLFNREVRANKSPRNAFDLSYSTLFTSPAGMLLPVYHQHVKRGDKLKLNVSSLTRTQPVVTPAYMAFDEKTDFWFVPYRLIWSDYDNWRLGQTYRHRTTELSGVGTQNYLPFTTFGSIAAYFKSFSTTPPADSYLMPTIVSAVRYLDLLNYSFPTDSVNLGYIDYNSLFLPSPTGENAGERNQAVLNLVEYYISLDRETPVNYFSLAAFQCIYMHSYRNDEYELMDPSYYNVDNLFTNLNSDNSTYIKEPSSLGVSTNYYLVPFERVTNPSSISNRVCLSKLFTPRYKNWRKDIFTSAKPNAGFNVGVSGLQIGTGALGNSSTYGSGFYWPTQDGSRHFPLDGGLTDQKDDRYSLDVTTSSLYDSDKIDWTYQTDGSNPANVVQRLYTQIVKGTGSSTNDFGLTFLYPQNLRNLMAQDKFSRAALYAKKDVASQIKALFGENYNDPHDPVYLGSYSTNVNIDDVTATAAGEVGASSSILGELAGKVKQGDNKNGVFERSFDDDGIVIGVHYVMPRNNYDSNRLSRWNTKVSRFDYYYPQFDGLGYQPVLSYERYLTLNLVRDGYPTSLFGFAPRYYEYKQRTNEVHGSFQSNQPDSYWTLSNNGLDYLQTGTGEPVSANDPRIYKILPNITDRIFNTMFDGSVVTDPFHHYYYFNATLVSDMEVYGTPSL